MEMDCRRDSCPGYRRRSSRGGALGRLLSDADEDDDPYLPSSGNEKSFRDSSVARHRSRRKSEQQRSAVENDARHGTDGNESDGLVPGDGREQGSYEEMIVEAWKDGSAVMNLPEIATGRPGAVGFLDCLSAEKKNGVREVPVHLDVESVIRPLFYRRDRVEGVPFDRSIIADLEGSGVRLIRKEALEKDNRTYEVYVMHTHGEFFLCLVLLRFDGRQRKDMFILYRYVSI